MKQRIKKAMTVAVTVSGLHMNTVGAPSVTDYINELDTAGNPCYSASDECECIYSAILSEVTIANGYSQADLTWVQNNNSDAYDDCSESSNLSNHGKYWTDNDDLDPLPS